MNRNIIEIDIDIALLTKILEDLRYFKSQSMKDDAGTNIFPFENKEKAIKELLFIRHYLEGIKDLYLFDELINERRNNMPPHKIKGE